MADFFRALFSGCRKQIEFDRKRYNEPGFLPVNCPERFSPRRKFQKTLIDAIGRRKSPWDVLGEAGVSGIGGPEPDPEAWFQPGPGRKKTIAIKKTTVSIKL